jgi:hypothetical protein
VAIAFPHRISDFLSASEAFLSALKSLLSALESFLSVLAPRHRWFKTPEQFNVCVFAQQKEKAYQEGFSTELAARKRSGTATATLSNAHSKFAKIRRI